MKKEKYWWFFEKDVPEKDWEAKMLSEEYKWAKIFWIFTCVSVVFLGAVVLWGLLSQTCTVEMNGSATGQLTGLADANILNLSDSNYHGLKNFNLTSAVGGINGGVKVSGNCFGLIRLKNNVTNGG